ncbi:MAG: hypothetical protein EOM25_12550, partial [Deltaproteobacteria bacterium]|nr:hypothetical protein [Deltaproteobacteria bacterium]
MKRPDYWQHKVSVFLHDPVHKALKIQGHEVRAAEIATLLHQVLPNKNEYQSADAMASGLTRAALPGHHDDQQRNGAVDFMAKDNSVITHPLVNNADLRLDLPPSMTVDKVHQAVLALLKKDIGEGLTAEELDLLRLESENRAPLNAFFNRTSDPEGWSRALFHYLFFALKKRLRAENAGGLGALWDFLPADTRMPDHAVWHHCGLASALASAMKDDPNGSASLAVFSITPVQPFIAKARKLRDHWVGSVILSYLSFTGLRRVSEALGPDHVMYPSLHDQTMVDAWLDREFHLGHLLTEPDENVRRHTEESRGIASFPNKFVFVVSTNMAQEVCQDIQKAIQAEWLRLAGHVREYLAPKGEAGRATRGIFDHQIGDYWQFGFAAAKLLGLDDTADLAGLLHDSKWSVEQETVAAFSGPYGANGRRLARLYSATHTLTQSLLAATKLKPNRVRRAQQGEKCPLCGEHEILHDFIRPGSTSAHEYKMGVKAFWDGLRARMNSGESFAQVGKNERLCAVCAMKRFLPQALDRHKDEPLYE